MICVAAYGPEHLLLHSPGEALHKLFDPLILSDGEI